MNEIEVVRGKNGGAGVSWSWHQRVSGKKGRGCGAADCSLKGTPAA